MPWAERAYFIMKEKNKIEKKDPVGKKICYCNITSAFQHFIKDSNVFERLSQLSNCLFIPFIIYRFSYLYSMKCLISSFIQKQSASKYDIFQGIENRKSYFLPTTLKKAFFKDLQPVLVLLKVSYKN